MKNIIGIIAMITIVILFSFPDLKAQSDEKDTSKINLFVENNVIKTDHDTCNVEEGNYIRFSTNELRTYVVVINNYDHFFDVDMEALSFVVTKKEPKTFRVNSPKGNNILIYSIGILNPPDPAPVEPESPPRIVITK